MRAWPDLIRDLVDGVDLSASDAREAMEQVMAGDVTPVALAGLLIALAAKGETVEELAGLSEAMVAAAVPLPVEGRTVDIVGTGGDRHRSVNISTMAALVVAGTGLRVVKHGNRAASSASGAADVLEALGVRLDVSPGRVAELAREVGITFAFAQVFHPSMRHAGTTRRDLGVPTVFNVLGPLTNPARPVAGAIGVANARMAPLMAGVFAERGSDAWVFRGDDGLDELTTTTTSTVYVATGGAVSGPFTVDPTALGLAPATTADLVGGDAAHNADVVRRLLAGQPGPVRDAVVLNAGAALAVHTADGSSLEDALAAGMVRAAAAIDSGAAHASLERWIAAASS